MAKWAYLVLGGAVGTVCRYVLSGVVYQGLGANFPYGTLIVNLFGCFIVGLLSVLSDEKFLLTPEVRILLMAGFCGAFTTFSTFILETGNLAKDGEMIKALGNVVLSVVAGFLVFRLGIFLGRTI